MGTAVPPLALVALLALAAVAGCASVDAVTDTAALAELDAPPVARIEDGTLHLLLPALRDEPDASVHPSVEVEEGRVVVAGRKPRNVRLRRSWSFDLAPLGYAPGEAPAVFWRDPDGSLVPLSGAGARDPAGESDPS